MPTRRRRCQPRSRKALRDYPQLFRSRPSTAATRVNNFKATDVASVSKVIHTDNQLQAGQFGKAAYTGWIRWAKPPMRNNLRRTLHKMVHDQAYLHDEAGRYFITKLGMQTAENKKLFAA